MKRTTTLLITGLLSVLLSAASFANCPDKTVKCMGILAGETAGHAIWWSPINYRSIKVHNVGTFFTGLLAGFKCEPCTEGCSHTVNAAFDNCRKKAKEMGYMDGYLNPKDLKGLSLGSAINSILNTTNKIIETAIKAQGQSSLSVKIKNKNGGETDVNVPVAVLP